MKLSFLNAYQFSTRAATLCLVVAVISFFGCSDAPTADTSNLPVSQASTPTSTQSAATVATEFSSSSNTATAASQIQNVVGESPVALISQATATQESPATQQAEAAVVQEAAAVQESVPTEPGGVLEKAGDLFDRAKSTTGSTAKGAKDWVQDKIGGAADASSAATQDTVKWATDTFESLKSQGLTTANDASEWLSQDWKNMESWEYHIVVMSGKSDGDITTELNELGKHGWECYEVSDRNDNLKFYMKKRRESYLRHLPFKDFIKLVPLMQQANQ